MKCPNRPLRITATSKNTRNSGDVITTISFPPSSVSTKSTAKYSRINAASLVRGSPSPSPSAIGRGKTRVSRACKLLVDIVPTCQNVRFTARESNEVLKKRRSTRRPGRTGRGFVSPPPSSSNDPDSLDLSKLDPGSIPVARSCASRKSRRRSSSFSASEYDFATSSPSRSALRDSSSSSSSSSPPPPPPPPPPPRLASPSSQCA
eukprot:24862-Pelagococcus_subviridis.AAC.3